MWNGLLDRLMSWAKAAAYSVSLTTMKPKPVTMAPSSQLAAWREASRSAACTARTTK